ncbi:MAG TPA: hypothetical protein VJU61_07705, partial [Polyangiaceae bacterium]|nr:hypothetical protein [Polyangiaceae bacterium]
RLRWAVAGALLMGSGMACIMQGASGPTGAAILATTAVAATLGYRHLTGGCVATCSKGWHCDHESGFCKQDSHEESPRRLVRPVVDAGAAPRVDAGGVPADAGG